MRRIDDRRSFLIGLSSAAAAIDASAQIPFLNDKFGPFHFTYAIDFEFEGRPFKARNVARLRGGKGRWNVHWYDWRARPSVFQLSGGRTFVIAPPSPVGAVVGDPKTSRKAADFYKSGNVDFDTMRRGLETARYPVGATPLAVILDNPIRPQVLEAFPYRAAYLGSDPIVRVMGMGFELQRRAPKAVPQASAPWVDALQTMPLDERATDYFKKDVPIDRAILGSAYPPPIYLGLVATCIAERKGDCGLVKSLLGKEPKPQWQMLASSLLRGEDTRIPLVIRPDGKLGFAPDPRRVVLRLSADNELVKQSERLPLVIADRELAAGPLWSLPGARNFSSTGFTPQSDWFGLESNSAPLNVVHREVDLQAAGLFVRSLGGDCK